MKKVVLFVNGKAYGEWQIPDRYLHDIEEILDEATQEEDEE